MRCPFCKYEDSKVIDSRSSSDGRVIRRRRECLNCAKRFTTKEYVEESPLMVVKVDGRREQYDRDKLKRSLRVACKKRPISTGTLDEIVTKTEAVLRDKFQDEIPSREIGELVMGYLEQLDEVAYVRFASVYRNFQDKEAFMNELTGLKKK
ncbi:transcriptional repressor NrdR [candidate division KSB1 bacterium]|nr:transcriptional repressor NrdR [candidate division KSB1 bacterium]NIR68807.1 transcriptional repressor NrdR [candidate division KSB1 bacterium]NIS27170.1 transcriptional repressor NrdR [candidate division KSB1 bacterium]NIT74055.1 transcriptional repressor NrdR [candidate division KSB1 bacterium]NIU26920.1 transcriptional repressor NrdR [candidate division KSB1 bacterium]